MRLRFREYVDAGRLLEARGVLEHRRYLAEVIKDSSLRASEVDSVVRGYLDLKDLDTLKKEILPDLKLEQLSPGTLFFFENRSASANKKQTQALVAIAESPTNPAEVRGLAFFALGARTVFERPEEAIHYFDRGLEMKPDEHSCGKHEVLPWAC